MKTLTLLALLSPNLALAEEPHAASAQSKFQERERAYTDRYLQREIDDVRARMAAENLRILRKFSAFVKQHGGARSPISCDAIRISIETGMVTEVMLGARATMPLPVLITRHRDHATYNCEADLANGSVCRLSANTDWTSFIAGYDNRAQLHGAAVVCFDARGRRITKRL